MRAKSLATFIAGVLVATILVPTTALATHIFVDVPDAKFYAGAAEWAKDNNITTGSPAGSDTFKPEDPVTRGESVTFLKRYDDNIVQPAQAALEGDIAGNASDIAGNASDIAGNASDIAGNVSDIADLQSQVALRTTAAFDGGNSSVALTSTAVSVASVTVDQPTSGRVILNSAANVWGNLSVGNAECSITTSSTTVDGNHRQRAETLTGGHATIAGTRGYTINKGSLFPPPAEQTYHLVCMELLGDTYIVDANLSAVFVPDPEVFSRIIVLP